MFRYMVSITRIFVDRLIDILLNFEFGHDIMILKAANVWCLDNTAFKVAVSEVSKQPIWMSDVCLPSITINLAVSLLGWEGNSFILIFYQSLYY